MKYGLEVEFFGLQRGKVAVLDQFSIPTDEYPLLAEARGQPHTDIYQAVASVRGETERMVAQMKRVRITPSFVNWVERDEHVKKLHQDILRAGLHKQIAWRNLHGKDTSEKNETHVAAGMHISFTEQRSFNYTDSEKRAQVHTYQGTFDFARVFRQIESEFGKEIDASERVRGFYELKPDGRIEYRSLPATLIRDKNFASRLAKALSSEPDDFEVEDESVLDDENDDV